VSKDTAKNIVYVSRNYFSEEKTRNTAQVGSFNWLSGYPPEKSSLHVKLRHGEALYACTLELFDGGSRGVVHLDGRDQGIAPGQFVVFYDGDYCLGSGVIDQE
jgi:tRNA-specific 2-thiouridylase